MNTYKMMGREKREHREDSESSNKLQLSHYFHFHVEHQHPTLMAS